MPTAAPKKSPASNPGFLDQTIGKLVYAIIPLNIFLTLGRGAVSLQNQNRSSLVFYISVLVILILFWGIATVKLVARRRRKVLWRLIALTPPIAIVCIEPMTKSDSLAFLAAAFLVWILASLLLAFAPSDAPSTAVHSR